MNKIIEWLRFTFRGLLTPVSLNPRFKTNRQPSEGNQSAAASQPVAREDRRMVIDARPPICSRCGREISNPLIHRCRKEPNPTFLVFGETTKMTREEWGVMVGRLHRSREEYLQDFQGSYDTNEK